MVCHDKVLVKFILVYKLDFENINFLPLQRRVNDNCPVEHHCWILNNVQDIPFLQKEKNGESTNNPMRVNKFISAKSDEGQQELFALTNIHDKVLINIIIGKNWINHRSFLNQSWLNVSESVKFHTYWAAVAQPKQRPKLQNLQV